MESAAIHSSEVHEVDSGIPMTLFKVFFLPLRLSCKESFTFLTKPLIPKGREDVTALRCSEPLRYKVGGPSKVYAMFCGMGPPGDNLLMGPPGGIAVYNL